MNGPPAGWRKRAILDLTGRWLDAHRLSVAWVCGRKAGPEKGGLRGREGIPGGYVMVQFGRNNRIHKAVCQDCITLYFLGNPTFGEGPKWAVVRAGAFLSRLRGMGGSSAILFIVIYYTCSKIVTIKINVAFLLHSLYSYGWESVPFAHRLQPARPPLPLRKARLPVVSHFFSRPLSPVARLPGHCRRPAGLFQPALLLFSPAGPF